MGRIEGGGIEPKRKRTMDMDEQGRDLGGEGGKGD